MVQPAHDSLTPASTPATKCSCSPDVVVRAFAAAGRMHCAILVSLFSLVLLVAAVRAAEGSAADPGARIPNPAEKRLAVEVGKGYITVDQVIEIWGPAWQGALSEVQRGDLSTEACHERLQTAWEEALETAIREEVFYQEAEREFDKTILAQARMIYDNNRSRGGGYDSGPTLRTIERELREQVGKSVEVQLNDFIDRYIRAAGGLTQLRKVIQDRGISWQQWRERIRRKAFTDQYLNMILGPRVPRDASPADIRRYFKDHAGEFVEPGKVIFRHILFSFKERGGETAARLAAGNVYEALLEKRFSFEKAAERFSDDTKSRDRGGLEDAISPDPEREAWLSVIREAARTQDKGKVGSILISNTGCHLVVLLEAKPGRPIPFRKAQRDIRRKLFSERWEAAAQSLYQELRGKVRVKMLVPRYPEDYALPEPEVPGAPSPQSPPP